MSKIIEMHDQNGTTPPETSTQLIERTQVENTYFEIVTTPEGSFVALGMYRISDIYKEPWEAQAAIHDKQWKIILNLITSMLHAHGINPTNRQTPE